MYSESLKNNLNEDISKHFTHLKTIEKIIKLLMKVYQEW